MIKFSHLLKAYFSAQKLDNKTQENLLKLKAAQLRTSLPSKEDLKKIKRREIYFILDNILDTYNTGGIFRLADALGIRKIYLCGVTETPPNTRIKKASI